MQQQLAEMNAENMAKKSAIASLSKRVSVIKAQEDKLAWGGQQNMR